MDERKEGRKEHRGEERSMAAACWQFFKESVRRLTGMNDPIVFPPLPRKTPFLSLKLLSHPTVRKSAERITQPHRIRL